MSNMLTDGNVRNFVSSMAFDSSPITILKGMAHEQPLTIGDENVLAVCL